MKKIKQLQIWTRIPNSEQEQLTECSRYDDKGQLLFHESFTINGQLQGREVYEYDAEGKLISEYYNFSGKDWDEVHQYEYGADLKPISKTIKYADGSHTKFQHQYDTEQRTLVIEALGADGDQEEKIVREYDENGLLIREDSYRWGDLRTSNLYLFDDQKRLIVEEQHDVDGLIERKEVIYFESGKTKERRVFDRKMQLSAIIQNEVDEQGRVIKQTSKDRNLPYNNFVLQHSYNEEERQQVTKVIDAQGGLVSEKTLWHDADGMVVKEQIKSRKTSQFDLSRDHNAKDELLRYNYEFWD